MSQETVKLLIPFKALADAITELSYKEKRRLWKLLDEQMVHNEELQGQASTVQTGLREAHTTYQAEGDVTIDEDTVQLKPKITSLLDTLPESRLVVVFDFVQFLVEHELEVAWINAQSRSAAYQEWVGPGNDIYDEVFADDHPTG